jgi:hypothetical protein
LKRWKKREGRSLERGVEEGQVGRRRRRPLKVGGVIVVCVYPGLGAGEQ